MGRLIHIDFLRAGSSRYASACGKRNRQPASGIIQLSTTKPATAGKLLHTRKYRAPGAVDKFPSKTTPGKAYELSTPLPGRLFPRLQTILSTSALGGRRPRPLKSRFLRKKARKFRIRLWKTQFFKISASGRYLVHSRNSQPRGHVDKTSSKAASAGPRRLSTAA